MVLGVKNLPDNAGDIRDVGLIPGSGRSPGEGNGNPLCQYSCLENPMGRGVWWATVHEVTQSWTWLKRLSTRAHAKHIKWFCRLLHVGRWWEVQWSSRAPLGPMGLEREMYKSAHPQKKIFKLLGWRTLVDVKKDWTHSLEKCTNPPTLKNFIQVQPSCQLDIFLFVYLLCALETGFWKGFFYRKDYSERIILYGKDYSIKI